MAARDGQQEIEELRNQVHKNQIFLNMVIHDMKNPTSSIKVGLQHTVA
jgi:archaellum component FlaC